MAISNNPSLLGDAREAHLSSSEGLERGIPSCRTGALIINADDWGRNPETTRRILECVQLGTVSSASEMVFMEDSERAAALAHEHKVDVGLHLNFTTPFSMRGCPQRLRDHQEQIGRFLLRSKFAKVIYHPGLASSFDYVVAAQIDEFRRLHGATPERIDGHHHMHLCANVLLQGLLPSGTIVRRHFSYEPGEKMLRNSVFRLYSSALLGGRYRVMDFFFSLPPFAPAVRMQRMFNLAQRFIVEMETHPTNPEEYRFLTGGASFVGQLTAHPLSLSARLSRRSVHRDSLRTL